MKKYIILSSVFILFFITSLSFAQTKLNFRGPTVTHRSGITGDSGSVPTVTTNALSSSDLVGTYSHLDIFCDVSSNSDQWRVSPLFWNSSAGKFFESSQNKRTVYGDEHLNIPTDQMEYIYIQADRVSGSGNMTIYVQGVNRY